MSTLEEFKKNFGDFNIPEELTKLFAFQTEKGFENYSDGFGLLYDDKGGLKSWSQDQDFLNQLFPFAQANGSGSFYALWNNGQNDLNQMPVVLFGDEGGEHIVAENIKGLLQILTYDAEPMVDWDEVTFYKDEEDHEPSEEAASYKTWLKENFNLEPIDPEELITAAQEKYQEAFKDWAGKYVKN